MRLPHSDFICKSRFGRRNIFYFVSLMLLAMWIFLCSMLMLEKAVNSDKEQLATLTDEQFKKIELEMKRRKKMADTVCFAEGLGQYKKKNPNRAKIRHPPVPNYEAFYFNKKDKLMWCPIYKSASTSWLYNFCNLAGVSDDYLDTAHILPIKITRKLFPSMSFDEAKKEINEVNIKFFIVRHPFERLLSAFRDKLERNFGPGHETNFYYTKYGKKIVAQYRKESINLEITESANLKLSTDDNNEMNTILQNTSALAKRLEPTFREFVRYLTNIDMWSQADEHWIPYYLYCTPCLIEYDVIAKFETLEEDQKYIIIKGNLQDRIAPKWKRLTNGKQSSQLLERYFSTLSKELLLKLYDKYRLDFEMFEYNIKHYLAFVK